MKIQKIMAFIALSLSLSQIIQADLGDTLFGGALGAGIGGAVGGGKGAGIGLGVGMLAGTMAGAARDNDRYYYDYDDDYGYVYYNPSYGYYHYDSYGQPLIIQYRPRRGHRYSREQARQRWQERRRRQLEMENRNQGREIRRLRRNQ